MASYEEHCRALGDVASTMLDVVKEVLPLQTFKESIDSKNHKFLQNLRDEMTAIGNDGLNIVDRARRPPCAILLGTSSAGKTELLTSFLPKLREFSGSTAADTTPMLVRLRYPKELNNEDHGKVTRLMPRDLYKLLSDLTKVRFAIRDDDQVASAWDKVSKIMREPESKRDEAFERRLYSSLKEWSAEARQWGDSSDEEDAKYFEALSELIEYFDPDGEQFKHHNPVMRSALIHFLNKGYKDKDLAKHLKNREKMSPDEADRVGKILYLMRTTGAITDLFVEENILQDIDVYDTAGVRVGGDDADDLAPDQMVHSQIQAFKNRWGFERLVASVDIIIFILVLEEQQVDTEFQALFEACRKHGNLQNRLFIFLNKTDKASDQAIKKEDYIVKGDKIVADEDKTWRLWIQTNVMDKIRGLGDKFHNVFICRAPKFKFSEDKSEEFLLSSKKSPTLQRYLYNAEKNINAVLDDKDGGIRYAWGAVEKIMRRKGSQIRYNRLGREIVPVAKDLLKILESKRGKEGVPTDKDMDDYMERLMEDLKDLRWRTEEFRLPKRFGEWCIKKNFVTSKQLAEALKEQEDLASSGKHVRIGQILLDKKYINNEQVREVLQADEADPSDWKNYVEETFKHVRERVYAQIVAFMEEKGRPIVKGNIPVEAVINYLLSPINILEEEINGLYTSKEAKEFQEAVQNVMECQLTAMLWNEDRLHKHLWAQKPKITSSFHIRDDISEEEAIIVSDCFKMLDEAFTVLPELQQTDEEAESSGDE